MSTGLDQHHPYGSSDAFYKVCLPAFDTKAAPTSTWSVRVASTGLYICTGKMMYVARSAVSGHKFPREVPSKFELLDNFSLISAGSFANASGYVHLCRQDSEIFVYRPERHNFVTIALPSTSHAVLSIAGIPDKLSLIDSSGRVFHSDGETSNWKAETSFPGTCSFISH
ncbi:hypothetical protein OESDEN_02177 [Oesophagostomum dentatum]|uniref:Uncharacterized protein n=1 Tax=Oesophagostomum dentatum TaxID=61180 RepID=A0A0B1TPT4_OESDE|nr:hypothetical protein OESDEN_02177 [Oesophagostomum dentatum]